VCLAAEPHAALGNQRSEDRVRGDSLPPAGVLVEDRSEAADPYAAMTGRSCRSDGTWTERGQVQMIRFGSPRNSQPIGQDRVQIVRARPKPRRQSRYVIGLPAILAELCRIVHR